MDALDKTSAFYYDHFYDFPRVTRHKLGLKGSPYTCKTREKSLNHCFFWQFFITLVIE